MVDSIKAVIMRRDGLSESEADRQIAEAREVFDQYLHDGDIEEAMNICETIFGLEPDYVDQLI